MIDTTEPPATRLSLLDAAPLLLTSAAGSARALPAGTGPGIGLLSLGKAPSYQAATSQFDHFKVYRL